MRNIFSLNNDVLLYIMEYLNSDDRYSLSLSAGTFKRVYTHRIRYKRWINSNSVYVHLQLSKMQIRSLDFGRCYLLTATMFASLTDELLLHKIRRLDVSGCTLLSFCFACPSHWFIGWPRRTVRQWHVNKNRKSVTSFTSLSENVQHFFPILRKLANHQPHAKFAVEWRRAAFTLFQSDEICENNLRQLTGTGILGSCYPDARVIKQLSLLI